MKVLIVGSAPSAELLKGYENKLYRVYDTICCINNSWSLLRGTLKDWYHSTDFRELGTLHPSELELKLIDNEVVDFVRFPFWYSGLGSGTMFLNTIYHIVNTNPGDLEIHVVGCDFDYSDKTKTHFYGSGKFTQETKELLEENASEYSDVAADPFRYGIAALRRELENTLKIPRARKLTLKTLSLNPNQLLPYERLQLSDIL